MKIEYRAWDKEELKMIEWSDIFFSDMSPVTGYGEEINYERFDVMQFTGMYDDRGNKIYDGDIVRIHNKGETKSSYISRVIATPYFGA